MINTKLLADLPLGQIGGNQGFGPWGDVGKSTEISTSANAFTGIISKVIGVMTIVAGLWFILQFVIAGFNYMQAGGDSAKVRDAGAKITNAAIGLLTVVASYAIISLFGKMLGFDILNPQDIITKL